MSQIIINGGKRLVGEVEISGAKNAALPIMIASLLSSKEIKLHNVPALEDINTLVSLLEVLGVNVKKIADNSFALQALDISSFTAPSEIVSKMRASLWVLGPLLARFGVAKVAFPGGCGIGARKIDLHIDVLKAMGAEIEFVDDYISAKAPESGLNGIEFYFSQKSVGATITAIMSAVLANGVTKLSNCAIEPEIVDLCHLLNKMGSKIGGIGTADIIIDGVNELGSADHNIISDRIEAGTYMIAAAITSGDITLKNISYDIVKNVCDKLEEAGIALEYYNNNIRVLPGSEIKSVNIDTAPFPGFPTDMQAQFMALMCLADGESCVTENIFENRFMQVDELKKFGAEISVNGRAATINGVRFLVGAEVRATDLRASVSLILAALIAKGKTVIDDIYHLDRGYENIEKKLSMCGADIIRKVKKEIVT